MMTMQTIKDSVFGGERPLYAEKHLRLERVVIEPGESSLKETADIHAVKCEFKGKYPFWCTDGFTVEDCIFRPGARAALWYSKDLVMKDTLVEAPKMFREMDGALLERVRITDAKETFWMCRDFTLKDVEVVNGDYLFINSRHIRIDGYKHQGNYAFQYTSDVEISNADIDSKDAFWMTDNVTVRDSRISGEYLGWHSKGLKLINCRISGTQPLCYAKDLILENCIFEPDADLSFEYSSVHAGILSPVTSVKNPRSGRIIAESYGEIILDKNIKAPASCEILTWNNLPENIGKENPFTEF